MYYDKQIRYIDYLENGEKKRNCGYVKITVTEGRLLLEMQIKGLYETDDVAAEVMLKGEDIEKRIGTVLIRQGSGFFRWERRDAIHLGEAVELVESLCYGQLQRIHVQLSPRRSLRCVWREAGTVRADAAGPMPEEAGREARESAAERVPENTEQGTGADAERPVPENAERRARADAERPVPENAERGARADAERPVPENAERGTRADAERPVPENAEPEARTDAERPVPEKAEREARESAAERVPERAEQGIRTDEERLVTERSGQKVKADAERQAPGDAEQTDGTEAVVHRREDRTEAAMEDTKTKEEKAESADAAEDRLEKAELPDAGSEDMGAEAANMPERRQAPQAHMAVMSEDKWQQLRKIYPHVRPFQDEREYLSLRPEDFVILHSNAYRLVQNSFLLHGYYNYEHLILAHISQRNANQYYIGVPGNFYEKEKQVAIMYGFESFECKKEPAKEGDFGYYMIRVEL